MNYPELEHKPHAIIYLAEKLSEGSLVLFLGAGTSFEFGLPGWLELVNDLRLSVGKTALVGPVTADDLQGAADEIEEELGDVHTLMDRIEASLYKKLKSKKDIDGLDNKLLISLAALLMGSRRGHVSRVITLNYDSMLEWFLSIFGFVVRTIDNLPALEGAEDVRIYHPHGYIPDPEFSNKRSNSVILSLNAVNKKLGTPGEPWFEKVRQILESGVCLFIGLSGNSLSDRALAPLFATCGEKVVDTRPLGIWLLAKEELTEGKRKNFHRNNIVPVSIDEYHDIPDFLLKICQSAMSGHSK